MSGPERRAPGRPRADRPVTDRAMIGAAAIEILRESDAHKLTITNVAARLDVRSQTLYHHVRGVSDIVDAARAVCISRINLDCLAPDVPFVAGVTAFAIRYAEVFTPLAKNIWEFFQHPINDPATIAMYETFLRRAIAEDLPDQRALTLMLDVEYAIFMAVFEYSSLQSILDPAVLEEHGATALARAIAGSTSATPEGLRARLSERVGELIQHACDPSA
ncbi:TetR/AcrR family transcriptional regulator [Leucobacter luti]|uniref:TetR family transcriptional regulator n=1 Tax=Leucobacter luti TaxID=340320 RepID=A0A4Q7U3T7_9MICO|nr:TetR/AcrR family transcriptional regulator [Leucobacter luti]MBL3700762.1 TetR/AcrR family transcriptional regulator [Leucobacter luti]RZT68401.1 hypothetical protein EV139_0124 [Leucobacter luti]